MDKMPHNESAERAVIASLLSDKQCFDIYSQMIDSAIFYSPLRSTIVEKMKDLRTNDITILADSLPNIASVEISECFNHISTTEISKYLDIIKDKYIRRQAIFAAQKMITDLQENEKQSREVIKDAVIGMSNISTLNTRNTLYTMREAVLNVWEDLEKCKRGAVKGIGTGIKSIDTVAGGFMNGELITIAGASGMGKSSFASQIVLHNRKLKTVVFSMEMDNVLTAERMLFSAAQCNLDLALHGRLPIRDYQKLSEASSLADEKIWIDDAAGVTYKHIKNRCEMLADQNNGVELIVVDHLQIMGHEHKRSRNEEISETTGALKNLARDLKCPILLLSQLSREHTRRTPPRPMLSDLRDSGAIEQDSDKVYFVYRPWAIDKSQDPEACEIIVGKNRNGQTGLFNVRWIETTMSFTDNGGTYGQIC